VLQQAHEAAELGRIDPPLDAPGGFLFVNWDRSRAKPG
jgi:hypothetical protein